MNDFSLLNHRKIIDILIGDTKLYEQFGLPYMSGPDLCQLCTSFGLSKTYTWGGVNGSRWTYMQSLLVFLNKQGRVPELLNHLFNMSRFEELNNLGDIDKIKIVYKNIITIALKQINSHLLIAKKELRMTNNSFVLSDIGEQSVMETPKVRIVTYQYIRELPERIKEDLNNKDYDSVITKSRTLLEEVLIYIIEQLTKERYKSNGDLIKIYQEATDLLNMRQKKEWDKRVNELLGGLHKIVNSISSMRNINSDAHGVGVSRISISEREALLVANSAIMLAEYWLGVFVKKYLKAFIMAKRKEIRNSTAEFLIFQIEGKERGVEVYYKDKTVWCTQKAMSMLFDCSTDNIGLHLKNIFAFGELYIMKQLPSFSRQFVLKMVELLFVDDAYEL